MVLAINYFAAGRGGRQICKGSFVNQFGAESSKSHGVYLQRKGPSTAIFNLAKFHFFGELPPPLVIILFGFRVKKASISHFSCILTCIIITIVGTEARKSYFGRGALLAG